MVPDRAASGDMAWTAQLWARLGKYSKQDESYDGFCLGLSTCIESGGNPLQMEARDDGYMPSIYLSILSHCVLPVDKRYRMCC